MSKAVLYQTEMTVEERLERLENIMHEQVEQNDKYSDYLDGKIRNEEEFRQFKLEVWKKVVSTGVLGLMAVSCSILWYAAQEWVKSGGQ